MADCRCAPNPPYANFLEVAIECLKKGLGKFLRGAAEAIEVWQAWEDCPAMEFVLVAVFIFLSLMIGIITAGLYGFFFGALVSIFFGSLTGQLKDERC